MGNSHSFAKGNQGMKFRARTRGSQRGFTLMELVIVMTIMAILTTVAVPIFITHIRRAREVVLMQNLQEIRHAIDKYITDKEKAPQSLQDLVSAGYLRKIPDDPITKSTDTWQIEMEKEPTKPGGQIGIENVRSGAEGQDTNGQAYSEY